MQFTDKLGYLYSTQFREHYRATIRRKTSKRCTRNTDDEIYIRLKLFDMLRCFIMVWSYLWKHTLIIINTAWFLDEGRSRILWRICLYITRCFWTRTSQTCWCERIEIIYLLSSWKGFYNNMSANPLGYTKYNTIQHIKHINNVFVACKIHLHLTCPNIIDLFLHWKHTEDRNGRNGHFQLFTSDI